MSEHVDTINDRAVDGATVITNLVSAFATRAANRQKPVDGKDLQELLSECTELMHKMFDRFGAAKPGSQTEA